MTLIQFVALLLLASIWGASYLFIRVAAPEFGPFAMVETRVLVAGLVLWGGALLLRRRADWLPHWRRFLVLGLLNSVIPFALIGASELVIPASMAAILNATTPLFSAVISVIWLRNRLSLKVAAGLLIAFAGVILAVGWSPLQLTLMPILGAIATLVASVFYAIGGHYGSRHFAGVEPLTMSIGQNLAAAAIMLPAAVLTLPRTAPSPAATWSVLALAVVCTSLAFLIFFYLLTRIGPTRTTTVTMISPVFGLLWSRLFLNEQLTAGMLGGLALTLLGIMLVADIRLRPVATPAQAAALTE